MPIPDFSSEGRRGAPDVPVPAEEVSGPLVPIGFLQTCAYIFFALAL